MEDGRNSQLSALWNYTAFRVNRHRNYLSSGPIDIGVIIELQGYVLQNGQLRFL